MVAFLDSGQFGSVYRVVLASSPLSGAFALKLAHAPEDARFEREASLLSRLHHPHVPAFRDSGVWSTPSGRRFPFLVMQEVQGQTLYEWAEEHPLTSRTALRLLAQLARALEATHALGALHRDVKGDNVRVSPEGHLWLLDFGACTFPGATPLTEGCIPPGTEPYRSPRIRRFRWLHQEEKGAHYRFEPADDVYALGATAYMLVVGEYPPTGNAAEGFQLRDELAAHALASVCPELRDCILHMLSPDSQARGTVAQRAQEMEEAARTAGAEADRPLIRVSFAEEVAPPAPRRWRGAWQYLRWVAAATVVLAALAGVRSVLLHEEPSREAMVRVANAGTDEGTQNVGEEAMDSQARATQQASDSAGITAEMPKKPLEGQQRPPCDARIEVELHGGCWMGIINPEDGAHRKVPCGEKAFAHDGKCYMPSYARPRPPTSEPR